MATWKETVNLIKSDFCTAYNKELSLWIIIWKTIVSQAKGQGWMFFFRLAQCDNIIISLFGKICKRHFSHKYCIDIPTCTQIGKGLYVGHGMCMIIHGDAIIGDNVSLSQYVTIGIKNGKVPVIGNNVYIGPSSTIIGNVKVGNNATIGAGSVVVKDVPDNAVVAGVPAKVLYIKSITNTNEEK